MLYLIGLIIVFSTYNINVRIYQNEMENTAGTKQILFVLWIFIYRAVV